MNDLRLAFRLCLLPEGFDMPMVVSRDVWMTGDRADRGVPADAVHGGAAGLGGSKDPPLLQILRPSQVNGPPVGFAARSVPAYFLLTFHTKSISLMIEASAMRDSTIRSTDP